MGGFAFTLLGQQGQKGQTMYLTFEKSYLVTIDFSTHDCYNDNGGVYLI